jgi:hypothetical protein
MTDERQRCLTQHSRQAALSGQPAAMLTVVGHEGKYNKLVTNGLCSFEKLMKQTVA